VKTTGSGFTQHRSEIFSDWACLPRLRTDDTCTDAAMTYAELCLVVIPDPYLPASDPLPAPKVKPYWLQNPNARVGLLVGHVFDVLAVKAGPEQVPILERLGNSGLLNSCFAQAEGVSGTLLLFASSGQPSQRFGLAPQGTHLVGRSGLIDVTPRDYRWLFVDVGAYGQPLNVEAVEDVL
jgi:hypothetical protein